MLAASRAHWATSPVPRACPRWRADTGLSRESLYKALGENGNPSFATFLKVACALGIRLHAEAA